MSTPSHEELQARVTSPEFKLYAEFGRQRVGLLWVVQAALLALQTLIILSPLATALPQWLSPVLMLPTYLAYFMLRERIWLMLYRRQGHLRLVTDRRKTRREAYLMSLYWAVLAYLAVYRAVGAGTWAIAVAWVLAWYGLSLVWGSVPGDGLIAFWTAALAADSASGQLLTAATVHWWRTGAQIAFLTYAARGAWEHYQFTQAVRQLRREGPPTEGEPR